MFNAVTIEFSKEYNIFNEVKNAISNEWMCLALCEMEIQYKIMHIAQNDIQLNR